MVVPSSTCVPGRELIKAGLKNMAEGPSVCATTASACPRADAPCVKMPKPEAKAGETEKMKKAAKIAAPLVLVPIVKTSFIIKPGYAYRNFRILLQIFLKDVLFKHEHD